MIDGLPPASKASMSGSPPTVANTKFGYSSVKAVCENELPVAWSKISMS